MDNVFTFATAWAYGFIIMASITVLSHYVFTAWFEHTKKAYACVGLISFFSGIANSIYFAWMAVNLPSTSDVMSRAALSTSTTVVVITLIYFFCNYRNSK